MAGRPGIVWGGRQPNDLAARVSAFSSDMAIEDVEAMLEEYALDAAIDMEKTVSTSGIKNGEPTGGGRIKSGAMINSIDVESGQTRGLRARAKFGFIKGAPRWTEWQEYGTAGGQGNGRGIKEMHALVDAFQTFETRVENELPGRIVQLYQGKFKF